MLLNFTPPSNPFYAKITSQFQQLTPVTSIPRKFTFFPLDTPVTFDPLPKTTDLIYLMPYAYTSSLRKIQHFLIELSCNKPCIPMHHTHKSTSLHMEWEATWNSFVNFSKSTAIQLHIYIRHPDCMGYFVNKTSNLEQHCCWILMLVVVIVPL